MADRRDTITKLQAQRDQLIEEVRLIRAERDRAIEEADMMEAARDELQRELRALTQRLPRCTRATLYGYRCSKGVGHEGMCSLPGGVL